jgi:uncharacterized protein YfaQ (DUF2300 family)
VKSAAREQLSLWLMLHDSHEPFIVSFFSSRRRQKTWSKYIYDRQKVRSGKANIMHAHLENKRIQSTLTIYSELTNYEP